MPIYEYECNACGERHEFIQKFSESPKRKCPACGKQRLRKLISAAAFHLKGDGWYVTDFRDKNKKKPEGDGKADAKSDAKASGAGDGAAKDGAKDGAKADSKAASKPAKSDKGAAAGT